MAVEDHLKMSVLLDGVLQVKLTNVSINFMGGAQDVETLEGWSGKSPGSPKIEVSCNWAVPLGGLEFNLARVIREGSYHDLQLPIGDESIISRGYFREGGLSGSVGSPSEATATYVGSYEVPE